MSLPTNNNSSSDSVPSDCDASVDKVPDTTTPGTGSDAGQQDKRVMRSEDIFLDRKEVLIMHGDDCYRLLRTRNGKLILQK